MAEIFLALEVSEQKIRHVILEKKGKGLTFTGTGVSTLAVDPSAPGRLCQYIKDLAQTKNIHIHRLFITLNRQDVIIQQITLPKSNDNDLKVVIPAEIERTPAFAEQDYDYIHRVYETENNKNRIIFVALREEWIKYLLKEIEDTRIPCRELEILPLNFTKLLFAPEFMEGIQALIILDQGSTFAIIFEKQQIKFLYTTNIGKDHLYPGDGIKIDKMACARWADELKRVFKAYLLDNKQETLEKTWFLWDRDNAPALDKYLREELNLEARRINLDQIPSSIDWAGESNAFCILSCVPIIHAFHKIKAHFSLTHFLRSLQFGTQLQSLITLALIFIATAGIILGAVNYHFYKVEGLARQGHMQSQTEVAALETKYAEILKIHNGYLAVRDQLLTQATYVKILNRMSWSEVLSVVAFELPEELSLTSFKVNETGSVTFDGNAFRMESIAALLRKIETSAILERGKFNYLTEQQLEQKKIFSYGILAKIKMGDERE